METRLTGGAGSAAAAKRAAILGPAARPSFDQPPVSRTLANTSEASAPASDATSEKSGTSCVQPTVIGAPVARAFLKRSSWLRQSWVAVRSSPPQPFVRAASSRRMVSSHEQAKTRRSLSIPQTRRGGRFDASPACPCLHYTRIHPNYDPDLGRRRYAHGM